MNDTPIYDNVGNAPEGGRPWIVTEAGRRWLYGVAAAVLVVVAAYLGISAADQESWLNLVSAVLNVGGAGALTYANKKVK